MLIKINLNINFELSDYDITFLRNNFEHNLNLIGNSMFKKSGNNFDNLINSGILQVDFMGNYKLTIIGKEVVNEISRDSIINKIINK